MSIQQQLPFEDVPVTCPVQTRYNFIVPCLAEKVAPRQQAKLLNLIRPLRVGSSSSGKKGLRA